MGDLLPKSAVTGKQIRKAKHKSDLVELTEAGKRKTQAKKCRSFMEDLHFMMDISISKVRSIWYENANEGDDPMDAYRHLLEATVLEKLEYHRGQTLTNTLHLHDPVRRNKTTMWSKALELLSRDGEIMLFFNIKNIGIWVLTDYTPKGLSPGMTRSHIMVSQAGLTPDIYAYDYVTFLNLLKQEYGYEQ